MATKLASVPKDQGSLKIEKGVPIPAGRTNGVVPLLRQMEIGDSIFLPGKAIGSVGGFCATAAPAKFVRRTVDGGVRIWRIA